MAARDTRGSLLVVGLLLFIHTWGAWGIVEVNMEDRVEVYLGETAQISCLFTSEDGLGGTIIQWFYVTRTGEKQKIYHLESGMSLAEKGTPFSDRISVNGTGATGVVVLTIENVQLKDEVEFICIVKSLTVGTAEGRTKLKVFHQPEAPKIDGVQNGITADTELAKIGTCEVKNGFPKPNITWYKGNTPIRSVRNEVNVVPSTTIESSGLFSVKSELSMKVVKEDEDALFYCEITFSIPGGTNMIETAAINITVFYPHTALKVWIESPKGHIKEGDTVKIQCSGDGKNPSTAFTMSGPGNSTSDSSVLVMENVTRLNTGEYVCSALDMDSFNEISESTTVFVNYLEDVVIMPKKIIEVAQGEEEQATCNAMSSLPTQTAWFKNGEEVSKGHTLHLKETSFDTAGTYVCVVMSEEVEGLESSGALRVHVKGQPEIQTSQSREMEESMDTKVDLSCYVRGYPYPSVIWSTSEGKTLPTESEKGTDDGVISSTSVKVTGDLTVFCNATNALGEDSVAFSIKAIHTTPETTSPTTTTTTTTTTNPPVKPVTANPAQKVKNEGSGVIIAVIIICVLLLAILGSVLYFLYKKGKICGRSGKQDLSKGKHGKDNIVVEMKSDNTEEAVLLGVNGEKQAPNDQ